VNGATPEATRSFAGRGAARGFADHSYRLLGRSGLTVSAIGFGAYRVDSGSPEHREALARALRDGCNLIDTSTNYTDGESESCIGEVLEERFASGAIHRDEVVVVSKIGYVQGRNLELARRREAEGKPFAEMVKVSQGCWHCIHPEFLEDQLVRSLERLRLQRLDVCLLHNPEYFLEHEHRHGAREDPDATRAAFYARIQAAFGHLEREALRGRIAWYGVSSNSFGAPPARPEATSLGRMLEAAHEAAREAGLQPEEHHFAVAQLPMNLFEHQPATEPKEGPRADWTAMELASDRGIGVLVNRPLNAFTGGELVRLADFAVDPPPFTLAHALGSVSALEEEFRRDLAPHLREIPGGWPADRLFPWGMELAAASGRLGGYEHWQAIAEQQIHPRVYHAVTIVRNSLPAEAVPQFEEWMRRYLPELGRLFEAFRCECAARSQRRSDGIASALDPGIPERIRSESLSRKALLAVASVRGVTCVLNGMRHPRYVEDSMGILKLPAIPGAEKLLARIGGGSGT
jgi:hypothetical protein